MEKYMKRIVLSILVENTAGVLSRISGLFSRRGYNIDSLTVGETQLSGISRMTVVTNGDDQILQQIKNQLNKLEDVKEIIEEYCLEPGITLRSKDDEKKYKDFDLVLMDLNLEDVPSGDK